MKNATNQALLERDSYQLTYVTLFIIEHKEVYKIFNLTYHSKHFHFKMHLITKYSNGKSATWLLL
jgi:hypothetical protein